jgi:transcription termination factor Rho
LLPVVAHSEPREVRGQQSRSERQPRRTEHSPVAPRTGSTDPRRATRPTAERSDRRERTDRNDRTDRRDRNDRAEWSDSRQPAAAPSRGNSLSVSIVEEMKRERRGNMAPPPPRRPELEMPALPRRPRTDRPEQGERPDRSERPERTERAPRNYSQNGNTPRGPQATDTTGRPSWGAAPARSTALDAPANEPRQRSNATKRAAGRERSTFDMESLGTSSSNGNGASHTAPCSSCGKTATLRFAPDLSRPVYCDNCFRERRRRA